MNQEIEVLNEDLRKTLRNSYRPTDSNMYEDMPVGFDENRHLREELDKLHSEYNDIIDQRNKAFVSQFHQPTRKSGYGVKRPSHMA